MKHIIGTRGRKMKVNQDILEVEFTNFANFIQSISGEKFEDFRKSRYLNSEENYKYTVYEEARENLSNKYWKPEEIGTGKILYKVNLAIKTKIINNKLINWRQIDDFSKKPKSETLEAVLFNFYKDKIDNSKAFEIFMSEGLSYQFIAYLFFIKSSQKFS